MRQITILLLSVILFTSCNFLTKESPLKREKKEIAEVLDGTIVNLYKSTKLLIKTIPVDLENLKSKGDKEKLEELQRLAFILGGKATETTLEQKPLSLKDLALIYHTITSIQKETEDLDEDDLQPLLPSLANLALAGVVLSSGVHNQGIGNLPNAKTILPNWSNNDEHALLAAVMASKVAPAPPSCNVYEAYRTNIDSLENNEFKIVSSWIKGVVYLQNDWYYSSEQILTRALKNIDDIQLEMNLPHLLSEKKFTKEETKLELAAITYLLRGLSKTKMDDKDKQEEALEDFSSFLEKAHELGVNNELIWIVELYLNIKKEKPKKSIENLKKLRTSNLIGEDEKTVIDQSIQYLNSRDSEAALNYFNDKGFMTTIVTKYAFAYFEKTTLYSDLTNNKGGQLLLNFPSQFSKFYEKIKVVEKADKLKEKALDFLN